MFGQAAHLITSMNGQAVAFDRQLRGVFDRMSYHNFPETLQVCAG